MEKNRQKAAQILLKHANALWTCYGSDLAPSLLLDRADIFLQRDSLHRIMNRSRLREVLWVELPGLEPVVLKRYFYVSLPKALWNSLRGTQWRREWHNGLLLYRRGVSAPGPLLLGERLLKGIPMEGFLVSQAIQGARSLTQELKSQKQQRSSLLEALALYLARIHAMGILHRDLHGENLLVGTTREGNPQFWLLDLHRIHTGKALRDTQRRWNLAQMFTSLRRELASGEEELLLEAYLGAYAPEKSRERWLKSIRKTKGKMLSKHQRSRTRRCLKESSGFAREPVPGGRVIRKRDFPMQAVIKALEQRPTCPDPADPRLLKLSGPTRVWQLSLELQGKPFCFCVKEHVLKGSTRSLLKHILPSRARRFWVGAWGMIVRGFCVPTPMAMWEVFQKGTFSSGVVMELVQEGLRMDKAAESVGWNGQGRRQLIEELASTLARMHSEGIFHRDLKATNLMVRKIQQRNEILFLDLEDVSFCNRVSRAKVVLNLAQLDASMPESVGVFSRLRFLRAYLGKDFPKQGLRDLGREVRRLSSQRRIGA